MKPKPITRQDAFLRRHEPRPVSPFTGKPCRYVSETPRGARFWRIYRTTGEVEELPCHVAEVVS